MNVARMLKYIARTTPSRKIFRIYPLDHDYSVARMQYYAELAHFERLMKIKFAPVHVTVTIYQEDMYRTNPAEVVYVFMARPDTTITESQTFNVRR